MDFSILNELLPPEPKVNSSKKVFSILLKKGDKYKHFGTGFFIGTGGLFFTAGHVFRKMRQDSDGKDDNNYYIGFPDSEPKFYRFKMIWDDSLEIWEQSYTYKDTAVGIANFENEEYYVFNRKRPNLNEKLTLLGYHSIDFTSTTLYEKDIKYRDEEFVTSEYNALISALISDYDKPKEQVEKKKFYNNCMAINPNAFKTESGSPILDSKGLVVGVLISGIKEKSISFMILAKYCAKTIRYRTYCNYNMYEDLDNK